MEQLQNILSTISNIEDRAKELIVSADDEKISLAKMQNQRIQTFDNEMKQDTLECIAKIQSELRAQMQIELDDQRAKTNEILQSLQDEYDQQHTILAKKIVNTMIGA